MGMKHCPGLVNLDAALPLKLQRRRASCSTPSCPITLVPPCLTCHRLLLWRSRCSEGGGQDPNSLYSLCARTPAKPGQVLLQLSLSPSPSHPQSTQLCSLQQILHWRCRDEAAPVPWPHLAAQVSSCCRCLRCAEPLGFHQKAQFVSRRHQRNILQTAPCSAGTSTTTGTGLLLPF